MTPREKYGLLGYGVAAGLAAVALLEGWLGDWYLAGLFALWSASSFAVEKRVLAVYRSGYFGGVADTLAAVSEHDFTRIRDDPHPADER